MSKTQNTEIEEVDVSGFAPEQIARIEGFLTNTCAAVFRALAEQMRENAEKCRQPDFAIGMSEDFRVGCILTWEQAALEIGSLFTVKLLPHGIDPDDSEPGHVTH